MAKLTLADLASLTNQTTAKNTINANNALIETALENTLSRDGTTPNTMGANLDMNSRRIVNLPEPVNDTEPLRKVDIDNVQTSVNTLNDLVSDAVSQGSVPVFATTSGLSLLDINEGLTAIRTNGFSSVGDLGGSLFIKVATSGDAGSGGVQSNDGSWWKIIPEGSIRLQQVGGVADGNFSAFTGTDNLTALTKALSIASSHNVPIDVTGIFYISAFPELTSKYTFIGRSRAYSGFLIDMNATQNGIWDKAGCTIKSMRIHVRATANKPANSGHLMNNIFFGYPYTNATDVPELTFANYVDLRLTRHSDSYTGSGAGIYLMGNVSQVFVDDIDDIGCTEDHTILLAVHWNGLSAGYGSSISKTWHPRNVSVGPLSAYNSSQLIAISSSYNITQKGFCYHDDGDVLIYLLPGDEANRFSQNGTYEIGKNISLLGPFIGSNYKNDATFSVIDIFSVGTSAFEMMPIDTSISLRTTLDLGIHIGDVQIIGSASATKRILNPSYFSGTLRIDSLRAHNVANVSSPVYLDFSPGKISIGYLEVYCKNKALVMTGGSNLFVEKAVLRTIDKAASSDNVVYLSGADTSLGTVSGAHLAGATTLLLSSGSPIKIPKGHTLLVNGIPVLTSEYSYNGVTAIRVEGLPFALSGGESVTHQGKNTVDILVDTIGGYYGIDSNGTIGSIKGKVSFAGAAGARFRGGSKVTLDGMSFENNGTLLPTGGNTFDVVILDDDNRLVIDGGFYGGPQVSYNIGAATDDSGWRRVVCNNVHFVNNITGVISYTNWKDIQFSNCIGKTGAPESTPNKTGSNANGNWTFFEDGTLICWVRNVTTTAGSTYTWTFPQAFVSATTVVCTGTPASTSADRTCNVHNSSASNATASLRDSAGALIAGGISLQAVGRWY